jgi:hypothetical protein
MSAIDSSRPLSVVVVGPRSAAGVHFRRAVAAGGPEVHLAAVVARPTDVSFVPNVLTYRSFSDLLDAGRDPDLVIIAEHAEPIALIQASLRRGWNVISDRPFTHIASEARRLNDTAIAARRVLSLGLADRYLVGASLGHLPESLLDGATQTIALRRVPLVTGATAKLPSPATLLLDPAGVDRLARALPLGGRAGRATVTARPPLDGEATTAVVTFEGGARLTVGVDHVAPGEVVSERLEVEGPNGSATLELPVDAVTPAPEAPPSIVRLLGGEERRLRLPTIQQCYALLLGQVLQAIRDERGGSPIGHLRLMVVLDAITTSLSSGGEPVEIDLP